MITNADTSSRPDRAVVAFIVASGFSSLVFETAATKLLGYVFGVSLDAMTFVLVVFFLGITIGSFLAGPIAERSRRPLRLYSFVEAGIGLALLALPAAYSLLYSRPVAIAAVLLPSILMGATMPLVISATQKQAIPYYYGANTFGAAAGVLISTFVLFPAVGLAKTALFSGALSLGIAFLSYRLAGRAAYTNTPSKERGSTLNLAWLKKVPRFVLVSAFLTGFLVFAFEVVWFNLLALVMGNSVYAFGTMLFSVLLGIWVASVAVERQRSRNGAERRRFAWALLALSATVYLSLFLWDRAGGIFALAGLFSHSFYAREATRFCVSFLLLFFSSVAAGMAFPLVLEVASRETTKGFENVAIGWAYAINAIGCAAGAVVANFFLVDRLGTRGSLVALGLASAGAAVVVVAREKRALAAGAALAGLLVLAAPAWDYTRMTGGQNVYFQKGDDTGSELLFHKESTRSGAITVKRLGSTTTLYTNGKFEGNNGFEVYDQYLFAFIPAIFANTYGKALNIGLGVGGSLGAISLFPFKQVDVAELSPDVVEVARKFFGSINFFGIDNQKVHVHVQDGRHFMMANENTYDLISMQVSSIWFAGSANLYNREFYELAARALKDGGIYQQWFQIHHISQFDLGRIIKSMRQSFPGMTVWVAGHQGVLVAAKNRPLRLLYAKLQELNSDPAIAPIRKLLHKGKIESLFRHLYFDSESLDKLLGAIDAAASAAGADMRPSTDLDPVLEFSTPRGNADSEAGTRNLDLFTYHRWMSLRNLVMGFPSEREYQDVLSTIYE